MNNLSVMGSLPGLEGVSVIADGSFSARGLVLVGVFLLVNGFLIRRYELTGLIVWTSAERMGVSESRLARVVSSYMLLISAATFVCAGLIAADTSPRVVELLYYGAVLVIVLVQYLHLRLG
jgi:hypothetical protein